jgi:polysaccharide pyruvyl transferase WcaK-like protein
VIADTIRTFAAVSVRDEETRELLRNECGIDAVLVVDPTLLVNFDELITYDHPQRSPYVLIYGSLSVAEQHMVSTKAAQMGCRIVAVGEFHHCADENLSHAGVESWLSLMRAAEMVFTGFFHGAIFAWKFGRPLVVFKRADKERKINGFANDMELRSEPFLSGAESDSGVNAIAYSSGESSMTRLAAAQERAQQFLRRCLK